MKDLQLIADKGFLFFLEQFEEDSKALNETKELIKRKIAGDNPAKEEWRENANANASAYANAYASANAYACAYANGYAYAYGYGYANAYAKKTADYIIELLGDQLENGESINAKVKSILEITGNKLVMDSYHTCGTTHCRAGWEIMIHPQGQELEKHFSSWMAATIIHRKSEGDFVDYFATEKEVMKELRNEK